MAIDARINRWLDQYKAEPHSFSLTILTHSFANRGTKIWSTRSFPNIIAIVDNIQGYPKHTSIYPLIPDPFQFLPTFSTCRCINVFFFLHKLFISSHPISIRGGAIIHVCLFERFDDLLFVHDVELPREEALKNDVGVTIECGFGFKLCFELPRWMVRQEKVEDCHFPEKQHFCH